MRRLEVEPYEHMPRVPADRFVIRSFSEFGSTEELIKAYLGAADPPPRSRPRTDTTRKMDLTDE